nr:NPP1 family protein [Sinorhizobium meliloti]
MQQAASGFTRRRCSVLSTQPHMHGTHPLVKYHREVIGYHFSLTDTRIRGGMQPAVSWSELTDEAREALDTYDFGMGVPFNTYNFLGNLAKSYSRFRYL